MDFKEFRSIVDKVKVEHAVLLGLDYDTIPSIEEIYSFEKEYKIQLPEKYIQFLLHYGGGYFGYANIYSLDKNSYFYLANDNKKRLDKLLFIADNECGDYYAFCIECGKCEEAVVFYNHDENTICDTEFSDIFEFLIKIGLNQ